MKETCESMVMILNATNCKDYGWQACGDLKVIAILLGLQRGFTKYCWFLCLWDSRAMEHFIRREWPQRTSFEPGTSNVQHAPLVEPSKALLPPRHIKVGLMNTFVKVTDKDDQGFKYLSKTFPQISEVKLKEGIFIEPQVRKLICDASFEGKLNQKELAAWISFAKAVEGFLGNKKDENYKIPVEC
jgi:hypothetical protein